jgi:hypothetical protein
MNTGGPAVIREQDRAELTLYSRQEHRNADRNTMTIALVSLAACVVGTIVVAIFDRPSRPEPIRVPVSSPSERRGAGTPRSTERDPRR